MARQNTIFESAHKGDFDLIKNRLEEDPSLLSKVDENDRILLHWCSVGGSFKLATLLVELGSPIDPRDDTDTTPLILASSAGHAEIVNLLLEKGANVNHQSCEGHSALQYAASKGWLSVCQPTF
jgi:ankyrin repeat protein